MQAGILLTVLASLVLAAETASGQAANLSRTRLALLASHRYQVRTDGTILGPDGSPVQPRELGYLIDRMESAQRLKALLQINVILSNSDGEKNLSPSEKEQVRAILRDNWPLLPLGTRKKFRLYFSLEELEGLNRDPAPTELDAADVPPLKDMIPDAQSLLPSGREPAVPALDGSTGSPRAAASENLAALQASLTAGAVAAPATAMIIPSAGPAPAPAPVPAQVAAPVPAIVPAAVAASVASTAPAIVPAPAAAAPAPAPPAEAAAPSAPLPIPEVGQAEFEKFLLEAPYTRDAKSLLRLIARKAPEPARTRALSVVMAQLPQVVFDADRAGADLRAALIFETGGDGRKSAVIALSPGAAVHFRRGFLTKTAYLLPQGAAAYKALGLPAAGSEAVGKESVAQSQEAGPWGQQTRRYSDGSLRGSFSHQQQAGTLLRELLRLDARLRGWDAWPYGVELYTRAAAMLFYAAVDAETKDGAAFLDPALRSGYREWLESPHEARDHWFHAWASARARALDPRGPDSGPLGAATGDEPALACDEALPAVKSAALKLETAVLAEAGLAGETELAASRQFLDGIPQGAPPSDAALCGRAPAALTAGRRQARALVADMSQAELRYREALPKDEK